MLSARTGDKLRAISEVARKGRRVKDLRRLMNHPGSTLEQRLKANICESCGKEGGYFEVHHVRKLKNLQGKEWWEQVMSYRKRKTMVLCNECHDLLHAHKLSNRQKKF
jgi:RNA-directed DNA polymerase